MREGRGVPPQCGASVATAPEHRAKIFERFYRVDKARSREEGGAGLGLAITKWSIERQGGSIAVDQREGGGSVFRVTLPTEQ